MSFRQFGFEKDDEEFFKDVFDSSQRNLQLARYSGARWRSMVHFYIMSLFFAGFLLFHCAAEEYVVSLLMAFVSLYLSMMSLFGAMSADGKYKLTKIVDELVQQHGSGWEKKC